ncbi:RAN GTPase-activating protein 2 isoform X1 [Solanum lycopersicum]|uniref:WPP domain-containing protein n=1 Tax=Solanum lycopersicum TaxID=4081 RepID=A0A3Q7EHM0_SOLLC|nr:RAN GTPase-activating protein 2 [Solanum lycopersicum]NP_001334928.1 RAN GTPase-activating protein 2 [Solanum lycopersicum]XP_004229411.1 RAN GTPase-activating protein 2 isoform X1 [Solanum lycopersicum]
MDATTDNSQRRPFSIKLWPPSENTRKMLVERMTNNLSSPTIFTRKYRSLSKEEAAKNAEEIEDAAFTIANQHYEKEPDGDGSSAVQLYARECSKLILEILKKTPKSEDKEISISEVVPTVQETFFDISKGKRAFIEAEEAQELLKPLKEPGNSYSKICFSNRSFGIDAARIAGPILATLKDQLKEVDLSDFVAGRNEAEALDVMNIFSEALEGSNLKFLNLSDNALGEKGVRAFGKLLQSQTNLEELFLMNDGISQEAANAVSELVPSTEKLKILHFHNNMTGDEGAVAIAEIVKRSPLLEDFRCSSTRVGSEGGSALCEALGMCSHLKKLDLRDNMFGPEVGLVLSKALSQHENLKEIYLSYLNLEDEGAIAIANALKDSAPSLAVLEMAGNDITAEAASAIASCIAAKQLLAKLSLGENELKDEGVIQIAKALEGHKHLTEVDMSSNALRRAGARVLAQTVLQKDEFKLLNVNGNFISEEGVDELKEIFKKSPEMLASLEDNDPEGEDEGDEEKESGDEDVEDELESKLKNLDVKQEASVDAHAPDSN